MRKSNFYKFLLFILTFVMIIPIQLNLFGVQLKITLIANTIMGAMGVIYYIKNRKIEKLEIHIIMYLVFLLLYVTINSLFFGLLDTQLINMMIFAIVLFIAFMKLGRMYKYIFKENFDTSLLKSVVLVGLAHSSFMIFSLINPDALYSVVNISELSRTFVDSGLRTPGLFYDGFAIISVFYSILFILALIVYSKENNFYFTFFVTTVLLISIGLTGRSGFLIVALGILLLATRTLYYRNLLKKYTLLKNLSLYLLILALLFLFFVDFDNLGDNLEWVLEPILMLINTGSLNTESTDILFGRMYFLPKNEIDIILGTGNFGRSSALPNIPSDSGYVLFIHGGGILGFIIFFSIYFYFIYVFLKYTNNAQVQFIGIFLIIVVLIGNIKDGYYFAYTGGWLNVLFIFLSLVILQNKYKKELNA